MHVLQQTFKDILKDKKYIIKNISFPPTLKCVHFKNTSLHYSTVTLKSKSNNVTIQPFSGFLLLLKAGLNYACCLSSLFSFSVLSLPGLVVIS
jgi:hypothetical protein